MIYNRLFSVCLVNDQDKTKYIIIRLVFLFGSSGAVHPANRGYPLTGDETRGGYVLKQPKKQKGQYILYIYYPTWRTNCENSL